MLSRLSALDARLRTAIDDFDFNDYTRALTDFANNDLSAFFFDIRKDCLYCDAPTDPKRRAYRTVLDILFHSLVRYAAPVLVFTSEEVWMTRWQDRGSIHLQEIHALPADWRDEALEAKWAKLREQREAVMTVGNGEGNFFADDQTLDRLEGEGQVVFRYRDNPNGSARGIAGIVNPRGNVLGMMPHPDRAFEPDLGSEDGALVFRSVFA